jgi:NADP-dependent 3-hydroxy acid dehydrogenase YdfG
MASAILRKAWQDKWAVVTGAGAGIGEAIAVELAEAVVTSAVERLLRPATLK